MVIIQTIAGTRIDHGGTSRSVPNICDALAAVQEHVHLITGKPADPRVRCNYPSSKVELHLVQESRHQRQLGLRKRFGEALRALLTNNDPAKTIVHDHGIWLASNRAVAAISQQMKIKRVVSPRGMLSEWSLSNGSLKKKIAWTLYQRKDLKNATAFHATGEQEAEDLRSLGFRQPIAIIPNGIVLPAKMPERIQGSQKRMLFLSRIHPKKGLLNLVRAWHQIRPARDWKLVLAGPDENGHKHEVEELARELGVIENLEFFGPVDDNEKWILYRNADLFVLPSFSENFGIVIAEALAAGLPVIATTPTPWQVLETEKIGHWVAPTVDGVAGAIRTALSQSEKERNTQGNRASEWACKRFSWGGIAKQMSEYYDWLLAGGERPTFINEWNAEI